MSVISEDELPFDEWNEVPDGVFTVKIMKPEGPIYWEGFDRNGNYGIIYENGAETWISAELIKDDQIPYSPGI